MWRYCFTGFMDACAFSSGLPGCSNAFAFARKCFVFQSANVLNLCWQECLIVPALNSIVSSPALHTASLLQQTAPTCSAPVLASVLSCSILSYPGCINTRLQPSCAAAAKLYLGAQCLICPFLYFALRSASPFSFAGHRLSRSTRSLACLPFPQGFSDAVRSALRPHGLCTRVFLLLCLPVPARCFAPFACLPFYQSLRTVDAVVIVWSFLFHLSQLCDPDPTCGGLTCLPLQEEPK